MGPRKHVLYGVHIGATWRIRWNRACAVTRCLLLLQGVCSDREQRASAHAWLGLGHLGESQSGGGHVGRVPTVDDQLCHAAVLAAYLPGLSVDHFLCCCCC